MTTKFKRQIILACLVTLLPIPAAFLLEMPAGMAAHLRFFAWASLFMALSLLLGIWITARDPGNKNRNQKPKTMVLWIMPIVSNLCFFVTYALAMGWDIDPAALFMAPMGLMFAAIGNYLPKCRMNSTIGIKVSWAYTSEENWNATHRFGGKLWFWGGIIAALASVLPLPLGLWVIMGAFLVMTIAPMLYSWCYYKIQKARGDTLHPFPKFFGSKKSAALSGAALAAVAVIVAVMMFAGDIRYTLQEDHLFIEADFYSDDVLHYDDIDTVAYRQGNVPGTRVGGYGSFRLLMGFFQNEEFGTYVRYTYYKPESCIVLTANDRTIVLSDKTQEQTYALYETLRQHVE